MTERPQWYTQDNIVAHPIRETIRSSTTTVQTLSPGIDCKRNKFSGFKRFQIINSKGNPDWQPINIAAVGKPQIRGLNVANYLTDVLTKYYRSSLIVEKVFRTKKRKDKYTHRKAGDIVVSGNSKNRYSHAGY